MVKWSVPEIISSAERARAMNDLFAIRLASIDHPIVHRSQTNSLEVQAIVHRSQTNLLEVQDGDPKGEAPVTDASGVSGESQ